MANKVIRTLAGMKDKFIGKVGTAEMDAYEYQLKMEVLGKNSF